MSKRKIFMLFAWCSIVWTSCNCNNSSNLLKNGQVMEATKEQKEGIAKAIEFYMEGGRQADGTITAKAFTENATMSWAENGKLVSVPIQTLYDIVSSGTPEAASYEMTRCSVEEDIATVTIKSQFGDAKYYDMFSMVKEGNEWKIVSKIYRNR